MAKKSSHIEGITPEKINGVVRQTVPVPSSSERLQNDQLDCEMCGSPMALETILKVGSYKGGRKWRARKFSCACGFKITVHGNGERDMCEDP